MTAPLDIDECDRLRMQRPQRFLFASDTPEYYRWYEYGGITRPAPLDADELADYLVTHRGYQREQAIDSVQRFSNALPGDKAVWEYLQTERVSSPPRKSAPSPM